MASVASITPIEAPFDGSGPSYGHGNNASQPQYAASMLVSGVPSVVPSSTTQAPPVPFRPFSGQDQAIGIGVIQHGITDMYSWRVAAPPIPLNARPLNQIVLQINMPTYSTSYLSLQAPAIPTGGRVPCANGG